MYTERKPYLATPGTDSCWHTWHNSTVQNSHHRQTRSHGAEGWKDASEDNKLMIVQCATFSKSLNPRNIDKSVLHNRIRIRFPFESSFWISLSGLKLTILLDIQPANLIVIISGEFETGYGYPILILLSNGNRIRIRISETLFSIFRGFRLLEKVAGLHSHSFIIFIQKHLFSLLRHDSESCLWCNLCSTL